MEHVYVDISKSGRKSLPCFIYNSLHKKFFRSQAQRAGNRQILEARKKLHKPELFFLPKHWRFGNLDMINLPETSSTVAPMCVSD